MRRGLTSPIESVSVESVKNSLRLALTGGPFLFAAGTSGLGVPGRVQTRRLYSAVSRPRPGTDRQLTDARGILQRGSRMAQTKVGSFAEAWANILVGFSVNFTANLIVLPWFGFDVTPTDAFGIGIVFTVISLARSYVLRRYFNGLKFGNEPK